MACGVHSREVGSYTQFLKGLPVQGEEEAKLLRVWGWGLGLLCLVGREEEAKVDDDLAKIT